MQFACGSSPLQRTHSSGHFVHSKVVVSVYSPSLQEETHFIVDLSPKSYIPSSIGHYVRH